MAFIRRTLGSSQSVFPLSIAGNSRYLISTSTGNAFPILGRTSWALVSLTQANIQSYLDDTASRGYTAIEVAIPHRWPQANQAPYANNGALLPFTKRLDGGTWTGSLTYSVAANEAPDFTQPNESYWAHADALIDYAATKGIVVLLFACYNGARTTAEGWMTGGEIVANGSTKMQTYGAFIGNRWANKPNIIWMLAGDQGDANHAYTGSEGTCMDSFITGLTGVTKQANLYSAELGSNTTSKDNSTTLMKATINFNGAYSWDGLSTSYARNAYTANLGPAFLLEEPYDEEGPDGNNFNPNATQPVRRFQWWGWLSSISGYISGNGYVWQFNTGVYTSHLNTANTVQMGYLNAFVKSLSNWQALVPDGLGGIGTLVTANGGTVDSDNYVAAAATPDGSLLVAYLGPTSGNPTIDMTKMRGTVTARWFDPTNGTYQNVTGQPFSNTGTRTFTDPGNNSAGAGDWVLRLDA